jgi:copper chaperone NosL
MSWRDAWAALLLAAALTACGPAEETAEAPPPRDVAGDVTGYFCGMLLAEHGGPKGQIHLKSQAEPVWFSSVRDTVAFTLLKEEPKDVAAIYVNDMGKARNWEQPEPGTWIDAHAAWFVIGSSRVGGMGLPEAVPFGIEADATAFAAVNGGRIVRLAEIPADYVLGRPEISDDHATH